MDAEAYNKSYGGGKWWVDQCGWGRPFRNEEAADEYIATMKALTAARESARLRVEVARPPRLKLLRKFLVRDLTGKVQPAKIV